MRTVCVVSLAWAAGAASAPPEEFREGTKAGDEWVGARGVAFRWCPAGEFTMGSPPGSRRRDSDEGPAEVSIDHGYWIGKYELTFAEFDKKPRTAIGGEPDHPINMVHWDDMRGFLRRLNDQERKADRLPDGWEYALPSEAQWEYAARAGTRTAWYFGDDVSELPKHANFADKSLFDTKDSFHGYAHRELDDGQARLAKVGQYRPNPWGLYDVYGNVWEWCETPYREDLTADPGKQKGSPVIRGGGWVSKADYCRSAFRQGWQVRAEQPFIGYRLVLRRQSGG